MEPSAPMRQVGRPKRAVSIGLAWEKPPSAPRGSRGAIEHDLLLIKSLFPEIRTKPGESCRVADFDKAGTAQTFVTKLKADPDILTDEWEFRAVKLDGLGKEAKRSALYVTFVGAAA